MRLNLARYAFCHLSDCDVMPILQLNLSLPYENPHAILSMLNVLSDLSFAKDTQLGQEFSLQTGDELMLTR